MAPDHWQLLQDVQAKLTQPTDFPVGMLPALADRLDEAMGAASRAPLATLGGQLSELFEQLLLVSPPAAVAVIEQTLPPKAAENAAYLLGQVSFAQLLAAQAAGRRTDDDFVPLLQDSRYSRYIAALYRQEYTCQELANMEHENQETVNGKLRLLCERGAIDFRCEDSRTPYFLTPAARMVQADLQSRQQQLAKANWKELPVVTQPEWIENFTQQTPEYMSHLPRFNPQAA